MRILALVVFISAAASAAEHAVKKSEVPAPVLESVQKKYPGAALKGFEKDDAGGRTSFEVKVASGKDVVEVALSPEGKILSEEMKVGFDQVPEAVKKALAASKYGKWKVRKAERIVENEDAQKPSYEIAVARGSELAEAVFDQQGNLIKEEVLHEKAR